MNDREPTPPEGPTVDVQRIRSKIREARFSRHEGWRWFNRGAVAGALCGVVLGLAAAYSNYVYQVPGAPSPPGTSGLLQSLAEAACSLPPMAFGGTIAGGLIALLVLKLWLFFRPVFVALFYSPREFDRQYGDPPPPLR